MNIPRHSITYQSVWACEYDTPCKARESAVMTQEKGLLDLAVDRER